MEMMEKPLLKFNLNYVKLTKLLHFKVPQHSQKVHSYGMQTPEKQIETISGFFSPPSVQNYNNNVFMCILGFLRANCLLFWSKTETRGVFGVGGGSFVVSI